MSRVDWTGSLLGFANNNMLGRELFVDNFEIMKFLNTVVGGGYVPKQNKSYPKFAFTLESECTEGSKARTGVLRTPHGDVQVRAC